MNPLSDFSSIETKILELLNDLTPLDTPSVSEQVIALKKSNMIRHHFVNTPLINYSKWGINNKCSYLDTKMIPDLYEKSNSNANDFQGYSPIYVPYHKIALKTFGERIFQISHNASLSKEDEVARVNKADLKINSFEGINNTEDDYLQKATQLYWKLNIGLKDGENKDTEDLGIVRSKDYLSIVNVHKSKENKIISIEKIDFTSKNKGNQLNIGLVNMKLDEKHIEQSYLQNPVSDANRHGEFNSILTMINEARKQYRKRKKEDIDVLILPEVSVPFSKLEVLCKYAKDENIMLIFGVEHWVLHNVAFNFLVTLVPFQLNNFDQQGSKRTEILPLIRLKNHYSPHEIELLKKYRYNIPQPSTAFYHLLKWRGVNMSIFNCFELADIQHRSLLRSEIDVLIASVYNQDTKYFSNIAETVVRDLHCFYVQVNDSAYGDSRITRPMKNEYMNQIQVKGGENPTILIDTLDIKELRKFQMQEYNYTHLLEQKPNFKPKPPGFNIKKASERWGKDLNE